MNKEITFKVNGSEKKITAQLIFEVFKDKEKGLIEKNSYGMTSYTDSCEGDNWIHKTTFNKDGSLFSEKSREFDEKGRLIKETEDYADGKHNISEYEYDDNSQMTMQRAVAVKSDGSTKTYVRCYRNFYNGESFDDAVAVMGNDICFREFDDNGRCIHFKNSELECRNIYTDKGDMVSIRTRNGKTWSKTSNYKSDDDLVFISETKNIKDDTVYFEIKDTRKTDDNPERIYAYYMSGMDEKDIGPENSPE